MKINSEDEKRGEIDGQIANLWIPIILRPVVSVDSSKIIEIIGKKSTTSKALTAKIFNMARVNINCAYPRKINGTET